MTRWLAYARESIRGIWFRATLFTLAGIVLAIIAHLLSLVLPQDIAVGLGQDAASPVLQILATSMLAVTTFSLTTMVAAYSSAAQSGTPRSTQLLIGDRTSQHALSTFVGAFAFSIVGIVALSLKTYSDVGRTLLFFGTILVIAAVLVTLLRWISFLTGFGRVADTIDRVERAASEAMQAYAEEPLMGGQQWIDPPRHAPAVTCDRTGFVVSVDVPALQRVAEQEKCRIWVERRPGARAFTQSPIAYLSAEPTEAVRDAVQRAFVIMPHRTFDQDPRLGLIALSEISSRALSPAVNDPGTTIEVLSAAHRVMGIALRTAVHPDPACPLVHVRPHEPKDMLEDAFRATSRDGAANVEVMMRIQRELGTLLAAAPEGPWPRALRAQAIDAFQRAERAMPHEPDIQQVRRRHLGALSSRDPRDAAGTPG